MNYKIAIPSHRRASLIGEMTLSLCEGIPKRDIYIFLSDQRDYEEYSAMYGEYNLIVTEAKNVTEKFNAIQNYWSGNEYIVVIEDDIKKINSLVTDKLDKILSFCIGWATKNRIDAWGVYPSNNKFFMSKTIDVGFTFMVANLFAFRPKDDSRLTCKLPSKNDYERSVLYHKVYGKIARFNFLGCVTNNYKNKGGMQEEANRGEKEKISANYLAKKYPEYYSLNPKRKSMYTELKINKRATKIEL